MRNYNESGAPMTGTNMETEPALTIGELIANERMVKTLIAAITTLFAAVLKFTVDDTMIDSIVTVVTMVGPIVTFYFAQTEQKARALKQAATTREAVYAPATVQRLVEDAALTGDATVPPPPAK